MIHDKTSAAPQSRAIAILSQLGRVSVFFLTAGFAYPNVFVEGLNPTKIQGKTQGDLYTKK